MKVRMLKDILNGIPDDAEVIIEAEYGQNKEKAHFGTITKENLSSVDCNDAIWEYESWKAMYDEDCIEEYPIDGTITGILLSSC